LRDAGRHQSNESYSTTGREATIKHTPPTVVRDAGKKSSTPTGAIKYRIEIKVREEQPQKA